MGVGPALPNPQNPWQIRTPFPEQKAEATLRQSKSELESQVCLIPKPLPFLVYSKEFQIFLKHRTQWKHVLAHEPSSFRNNIPDAVECTLMALGIQGLPLPFLGNLCHEWQPQNCSGCHGLCSRLPDDTHSLAPCFKCEPCGSWTRDRLLLQLSCPYLFGLSCVHLVSWGLSRF